MIELTLPDPDCPVCSGSGTDATGQLDYPYGEQVLDPCNCMINNCED